jgi:hypothetical protein
MICHSPKWKFPTRRTAISTNTPSRTMTEMFMAGAAMAGFFGWVAGAHHMENPPAGNRRPGSDPLPLPRRQTRPHFLDKIADGC